MLTTNSDTQWSEWKYRARHMWAFRASKTKVEDEETCCCVLLSLFGSIYVTRLCVWLDLDKYPVPIQLLMWENKKFLWWILDLSRSKFRWYRVSEWWKNRSEVNNIQVQPTRIPAQIGLPNGIWVGSVAVAHERPVCFEGAVCGTGYAISRGKCDKVVTRVLSEPIKLVRIPWNCVFARCRVSRKAVITTRQ